MNTVEEAKPALKRNTLLERLTLRDCEPVEAQHLKCWRFGCGLAVADELTFTRIDRKAVAAAKDGHKKHHVGGHESHGDEWSLVLHTSGNGFWASCP